MRIPLGPVTHFSIGVADPDASARWWTSLFDLEEYRRTQERVVLGNDELILALFRGKADPAVLGHLAFRLPDVGALESALAALRAAHVDLEDPGDEIGPPSPGSKSLGLWFRDPDGYRWELLVPAAD
jgi:catechol 2,3-dioxygenase-like lactoylglutathione lyase family enzyme